METTDHAPVPDEGGSDRLSFVVCRTAQGTELHGTLHRLTRFAAVFEVYNPYSILQLSEVLSDFRIFMNDRVVYSSRAVIANLVNTGIVVICEASLNEEGWIDIDLFSPVHKRDHLLEEFQDFIRETEKIYRVLPDFKVAVADMQVFLGNLRRWMEQVELGLRSLPAMDRLRDECPVALAVSLHAPNDALRDNLVPLNRKYPLRELLQTCVAYLEHAPRDFITFEYCMLDGVNDAPEQAQELVRLVSGQSAASRGVGRVPCKLNLIPFNPFPASGLKRSPRERVLAFAKVLQDAGIVTTIRKTRGDDIAAACGQLAGEVQDRTNARARLARRREAIPIAVAGDAA